MKSKSRCSLHESEPRVSAVCGTQPSPRSANLRALRLWYRRSAEEGQSLVEFAVVVPLLLLVLTGIFSFGIIFNQYEVLTNATNSAARYFAASRDASKTSGANTMAPSGDACAYVATVVNGDSPNLTATSLKYKIVYTVAATKAPSTLANSTNAPSCSSLSMTGGDTVTVTVTYPVSTALFGWATQNYTLSASSTELVQ